MCLCKNGTDILFVHTLGEVCSHVAAVLKVEACVQLGVASMTCTSLPFVWNQAFSNKVNTVCDCNYHLVILKGARSYYGARALLVAMYEYV